MSVLRPSFLEERMISHNQRRAQLQARYAELERRIVAVDADLNAEHSSDLEELAVEHEDDEVLEGVGNSAQREVRQIEAALERLDSGEYGVCTNCGDPIQEERLNILPYTAFCRDCAK
jgi:RNA polymerase-binding transcription factor DksA